MQYIHYGQFLHQFHLRPPKCPPRFPFAVLFLLLPPLLLNERVGVLRFTFMPCVCLFGLNVLLGLLTCRLFSGLLFSLKFMPLLLLVLGLAVVRVLLSRLFLRKFLCPLKFLFLLSSFLFCMLVAAPGLRFKLRFHPWSFGLSLWFPRPDKAPLCPLLKSPRSKRSLMPYPLLMLP